jgi:hypothetical protein
MIKELLLGKSLGKRCQPYTGTEMTKLEEMGAGRQVRRKDVPGTTKDYTVKKAQKSFP